MQNSELPKSYDPNIEEPKVRDLWEHNNPFHIEPEDSNKATGSYCIVIPPPNVTAPLHLGHALNNTLQDVLIRYHRAKGMNTLWLPGTDHAGIATQTVVDKRLQAEGKPAIKDYKKIEAEGGNGRDQFIEKVQAWKDEYEADICVQLKLMGCSCDWSRQRFTMDEMCATAVREAFFQLFKDGLIYRGKRLVNWDPATQTALADDEVENEEVDGYFWYLNYPVVDEHGTETGEYVTVATTRPETMLGDTAIAVNPRDTPRAQFIGKKVRLPIVGRIIEVIEDDYVVIPDPNSDDPKASFASGFLKVTPAHDTNDWEIGVRHNLEVINVLAPDGTISEEYGWDDAGEGADFVVGLDRYEARDAIVTWFRENNLLAGVKPYTHTVGHSYRSHVAIEPYLSDQWYVGVTKQIETLDDTGCIPGSEIPLNSLAGKAWNALCGERNNTDWFGKLSFHPDRYAKTYQTWHENLRDWCISRQLWWGHRIPVWRTQNDLDQADTNTIVFKLRAERVLDNDTICIKAYNITTGELHDITQDANRPDEDQHWQIFACLLKDDQAIIAKLEKLGLVQDPDVLDTWFSSALWPMSTMGWPHVKNNALLDTFNPTNVLCTAREIITLWVSRMVMFNTYFLDRLPFNDVFIHAMIQDGEGRKMSKSLGNGVDPRDIITSKGTDAMRFVLAQMTTQTQDVRMPVEYNEDLHANTSPKFEIGRRLCNKLWNATRYAMRSLSDPDTTSNDTHEGDSSLPPSRLIDRWMLSKLATAIAECDKAVSEYQFNNYAQTFYDLFWRDFCDWYLEGIKGTVQDDATQQQVLRATLGAILRIAHPLMPFITETLHESIESLPVKPHSIIGLPKSNIAATARWPIAHNDAIDLDAETRFEEVRKLVSAIREIRSHQNVPDKRRIVFHVSDDATLQLITDAQGVVEMLAGLETITKETRPADGVAVTIAGVEHGLSNLADKMDAEVERKRLLKRQGELRKQIGGLKGRLSNKGYIDKAPAHLVDETKQQLVDAESECARVGEMLAELD